MDRQGNMLQSNSATRSKIAECARRFIDGDPASSWLHALLEARGIDPSKGILAAYSEKLEPGGRNCTGTWLTSSGEFWEFQALVPAAGNEKPALKFFDERSVSVFAHERGIAKSFGALAIEARDEVLGR